MLAAQEVDTVMLVVAVFGGIVVYLLPAIIATSRIHQNQGAITVLNVAFGWTILGWVVALVWSVTEVHKPGRRRVYYVVDDDEEEAPPRLARRRRAE